MSEERTNQNDRTQPEDEVPSGVISGVALLDLTSMRTPEDLSRIRRIDGVAVVLVPESLAPTLSGIPTTGVASVVPVPDAARVKVHTGAVVLPGDALASPEGEDEVLVVTGALLLTSPVRQVTYRQVVVTGVVVAPEGSEAVLLRALTRVTGSVRYYPYAEGHRFRVLQGETRLSGASLASGGAGASETTLLVAGSLTITSPVTSIAWEAVTVLGQMIAPRESELVLADVDVVGETIWYEGTPRIFRGQDRFSAGFFELLDGPTTLVLSGQFTFEADVTPELLRAKVSSIALSGQLLAPKALLPTVQLLTTEKRGLIVEDKPKGDDAS